VTLLRVVTCGLLIIIIATPLNGQSRTVRAHRGTALVNVLIEPTRIEVQSVDAPVQTAAAWNYSELQCTDYTREAEPLQWGPWDVLTSFGKKMKNWLARNSIDHWITFVPKLGERVRLQFSDVDVMSVNDGLRAQSVPQCSPGVARRSDTELVQPEDLSNVQPDAE
jgi:hypothetical protein